MATELSSLTLSLVTDRPFLSSLVPIRMAVVSRLMRSKSLACTASSSLAQVSNHLKTSNGVPFLAQRCAAAAAARAFSSKPAGDDVIGIDLGTTNSCVSVMTTTSLRVIENAPSVVAFNQKGELLVGTPAKRQAVTNLTNTLFGTKRLIGRKFDDQQTQKEMKMVPYKIVEAPNGDAWVEVNGQQYSPSQIGAFVLTKMKETAESYLGKTVSKAVITVPAHFNAAQRQATKDACKIAGLDVLRIINEPIAAALSHWHRMNKYRSEIAVFHLGGGTFDVSIFRNNDGVFRVLATNGDTSLGGEDFDSALLDYLVSEFKRTENIDLTKDRVAIQRLREAAEKAKVELSSTNETEINLPLITSNALGAKNFNITLTRSKFESLVSHLIERMRISCKNCLKDADIIGDVTEVLLVGGMSRVPKVQQIVSEIFGKAPSEGVNPDEAVAIGAAIQGGILLGNVKVLRLIDVTSLSLGIQTLGGIFTRLINRNTTIPTKESQVFSTASDNQTQVGVRVWQSERDFIFKDNKLLGEFELTGIPPAPRGKPQIEVTLDIDANGIVTVSATDKATGKEQAITIKSSCGLTDAEIEKMVKEAEIHAKKDKEKTALIDNIRNIADTTIYSIEKSLSEYRQKIPTEVASEIESVVADLRTAMAGEDVEAIKAKTDAANKAMTKIGEHMSQSGGGGSGSQGGDQTLEAEYTEAKM